MSTVSNFHYLNSPYVSCRQKAAAATIIYGNFIVIAAAGALVECHIKENPIDQTVIRVYTAALYAVGLALGGDFVSGCLYPSSKEHPWLTTPKENIWCRVISSVKQPIRSKLTDIFFRFVKRVFVMLTTTVVDDLPLHEKPDLIDLKCGIVMAVTSYALAVSTEFCCVERCLRVKSPETEPLQG